MGERPPPAQAISGHLIPLQSKKTGLLRALEPTATVLAGTGIDFPFPVHVCEEIEGSISGCLGLHKGCDDGYCLQNGSLWRRGEG